MYFWRCYFNFNIAVLTLDLKPIFNRFQTLPFKQNRNIRCDLCIFPRNANFMEYKVIASRIFFKDVISISTYRSFYPWFKTYFQTFFKPCHLSRIEMSGVTFFLFYQETQVYIMEYKVIAGRVFLKILFQFQYKSFYREWVYYCKLRRYGKLNTFKSPLFTKVGGRVHTAVCLSIG